MTDAAVKMAGGDTQDDENGIVMPNLSNKVKILILTGPPILLFHRLLAPRPRKTKSTHILPRIVTPAVAKQDGVDSSGEVGARIAVVIYLVRLHYVTMSKILSNYHLTKNVMDFGV